MSSYQQFDVTFRDKNGLTQRLPSQTLKIHNLDADVSLGTVASDTNGIVSAGTLYVTAGTRVSFRIENYRGLAMSLIQITT